MAHNLWQDFLAELLKLLVDNKVDMVLPVVEQKFSGTLSSQEEQFVSFNEFLKSLYGSNSKAELVKLIPEALKNMASKPEVVGNNRFTKAIFKAMIDWCSAGNSASLAMQFRHIARDCGCYV